MASNEWLVRKLHEQDKKIEALSRGGTGVGHTSIAPGENLTVLSDNGEVVLGAGGVEHVDGPTPATPSAPTLKLGFGTIEVTWDGSFAEGEDEDGVPLTAPTDLAFIEVHASTDPEEEEWGDDTRKAQVKTKDGFTVTVGGFDVDDEVHVCLIAVSEVPKSSAPSATASLVIEGLDFAQLTNELDAATVTIDNAREVLLDGQNTLGEKLDAADTALSGLETSLGELDSTTLPALRNDLDAAEGRLTTAEGQITNAFGQIDAVPGQIATARQEAIDAALAEIDTVEGGLVSSIDKKVTWSLDAPPVVFDGPADATWFRVSSFGSGGQVVSQWRWNGTVWVSTIMSESVLAKINIGTGTFGSMSGSRLDVGSVAADRVLVGAGRNLVPWSQVLSGSTTAPHGNYDFYGSGTFTVAPADAGRGVPVHAVHNRATADPGVDRYIIQFRSKPYTGGVSDRFAVSGGVTWTWRARAYTDVENVDAKMSLTWYKADGGYGGLFTGPATRLGTIPVDVSVSAKLPSDAAYLIPAVRTNQPGETHWVNPELAPAVGGTLIEPGGIQTPHLAADVLEVGNLKAGTAAIAEAVVQKIAAQTASIQQADVENLFVTGTSSLSDVVAEQIAADTAKFIELEVGNLVAGSGIMDEATIEKLFTDVVVASMAQAQEFIGENAILTGAVTAPKITASEELWAKIGEFVKIRAEHMQSDAIDGMVITAPTIQSAHSGRRWVGDPNGIRVINEDNDVRTQLSPDGSTFKGEVEADTLVVNEGAEFKGNNTLAQGAQLTLAAGVTDPTSPPVVQPYWEGLEFTPVSMNNSAPVGLAWDGTNYITVGSNRADTGATAYYTGVYAMRINGTTGVASQLRCDFSAGELNEQRVSEVFGVTCIGSELFFLGRYGYAGYVWVTDLDGVFKRRFSYPDLSYSATNRLVYRPGIGNNGSNLVVAQCNDSGILFLRTYDKITGAKISDVGNEPNDGTKSDITGVHVGTADWGRSLATVAKSSTYKLPSFNPTTGVYDGATTQFNAASNNSVGVVFVDGKFRTLDPAGVIHEYADNHTGDSSGDWWATYYWYTDVDDDSVIESSDYQSRMAPPARFTWPRRAMLKILGQPMPTGVEALGPALAKKTTEPVRTDFSGPGWQVDSGKPSARYVTLPTNWTTYASPSATNTFPEAESSSLETASGTFELKGDGSGHWGPLKMGRNGVMSGLVVTGQVSCQVDTAGTPKKFTVQLPAGRFTKPPVVWVSPLTTSPQNVAVSVVGAGITTTSFDLWFYRNDLSGTGVDWLAMDSE